MVVDIVPGTVDGVVSDKAQGGSNITAGTGAAGRVLIGKVGAPPEQEATSGRFFFWVPPSVLVETTQLVVCASEIASQLFQFYAIVDEVHRRSRKRDMGDEVDEADSDLAYEPPFATEGYTYAEATILRAEPAVLTPPRERSDVYLAGPDDARLAYAADQIERPLPVGVVKNGGSRLAGVGMIDLDYLLGQNGGHMLVNGTTGRGTKTSFLLQVLWLVLYEARTQQHERPSDPNRLRVVPVVFNVKGYDLFYIDRPNAHFEPGRHLSDWQQLGVEEPVPFEDVTYFAAQQPGSALAVATGRQDGVKPYSWSLRDIIARGLLPYLFAEADAQDSNFSALILDIGNWLTEEKTANDGNITRLLRSGDGRPATFQTLLDWARDQAKAKEIDRALTGHHPATWQKLARRLLKLVQESPGVLRKDDQQGNPLNVVQVDTSDPIVIDLSALAAEPELQRFVVATVLRQLIAARTGTSAIRGLTYLLMIDELNRFAPRGASDPITHLVEMVAAEMRSQGIILLGAQQQASKVSEKVVENAAIRVLGKSGSLELSAQVWRFLSDSARRKAESLPMNEKLVVQDNFREPMHVRVPFPAWAMNPREAGTDSNGPGGADDAFLQSMIDQ